MSKSVKRYVLYPGLFLLAMVMAAIIFVMDIQSSGGLAIGAVYCIVILYSWLLPGQFSSVYAGLVCTILLFLGMVYSQANIPHQLAGINKIISLVVIWVSATLVALAKRSFSELEKSSETLENQVAERTAELAKSEERIRMMVEEVQDYAILLLDTTGKVENWNMGGERIKGYKAEEIIGKNFRIFYTEEDREAGRPEKLIRLAIQEGRAQDEAWRVRKDGTFFWASTTLTAIHNRRGEIVGISKVTRDLTKLKQAEESKRREAILEAQSKEMEQFVYVASHDLQEPLNSITGYIRCLHEEYAGEDESVDKYLGLISGATLRMSGLIKALREYSRIGRNKELVIVDCNLVIRELIQLFARQIEQTGATIHIGELPQVKGYEAELRLLFESLLDNALKFRRPDVKPLVRISAKRETDMWIFSIGDNGLGIDMEQHTRIFYIFQRLHLRTQYEGLGIGLAYCRRIAELHGGTIWLESELEVGSTFYFSIPA